MFCCGYHKQPILVVLNRNTNRSEVFREPMALTANLAAIWPWPATTADGLYGPFRRGGPLAGVRALWSLWHAVAGVGKTKHAAPPRSTSPAQKSDAAWRDVAIHVIAPAQEDDPVAGRI